MSPRLPFGLTFGLDTTLGKELLLFRYTADASNLFTMMQTLEIIVPLQNALLGLVRHRIALVEFLPEGKAATSAAVKSEARRH